MPLSDKENFEYYKNYWSQKNNPEYFDISENWFEKYYKEVLFHIPEGSKSIVDVGCGSGEYSIRMSKDFESVTGIDFASSMVTEARKKIEDNRILNVKIHQDNALNINKIVKEKVDVVFSHSAIQYFTINQVEEFLTVSKELINDTGTILLMNILNNNLQDLYYLGIFHNLNKTVTPNELLKKLIAFRFTLWKEKIKNKNYNYDLHIGFWHSTEDYLKIAQKLGLQIEFFQSMYPPYGYRFHVKLSKK